MAFSELDLKRIDTIAEWRLYWRRASLMWCGYQPLSSSGDLADLVDEIDRDPHGCFFG